MRILATCGLWHFPAEPSRQVLRQCFMGVRGFAFQPDSDNSQFDIFSKLGMPQNSKARQTFVKFLGVQHLLFGIYPDHTQLTSAAIAPVTVTLPFSQEPSALRWFAASGSHHHLHLAA